MPFFKSMPDDAGPANVFRSYPDLFGHWVKMGQALMNGPSPFTPGERENAEAFPPELPISLQERGSAAFVEGLGPLLSQLLRGKLRDSSRSALYVSDPSAARPLVEGRHQLALAAEGQLTDLGMSGDDGVALVVAGILLLRLP